MKALSLILALAVMGIALPCQMSLVRFDAVGICARCHITGRLLYPFFHAGMVHAALNVWCLLSVVFLHRVSPTRAALAYLAAVSVPDALLPDSPTVGLSGVVSFLFGSLSLQVARKLQWQAWMLAWLALGFLLPGMGAALHAWCYALGLLYAVLNKPIPCGNGG